MVAEMSVPKPVVPGISLVVEKPSAPVDRPYVQIEMGRVRYIGSKARVVDEILDLVGPPGEDDGVFVDAFCGTGVVGAAAAQRGWAVRFNDSLRSAVAVATARLVSPDDAPFESFGGYEAVVTELNALRPVQGFFHREYSPAGAAGRMYFSEANAAHIDAVRAQLKTWGEQRVLNRDEHELLIADLISAAARVANIAGTYGCYLSKWTSTALRPFALEVRQLNRRHVDHSAHCGDVVDTPMAPSDVAYFDPPYTKRQYAAYYHINETLACEDEPALIGKTGLRPWQDKASAYCYKRRALGALTDLIENAPALRVLLSYSSEGHVALDDLLGALSPLGDLQVHELGAIGRYRPNAAASAAAAEVTEYVLELRKSPVDAEVGTPA
jgi:adenine-specific DNA-methyltransferase